MDLGLRDDVAVVVGGASGIGKAIACAFAAEGSRVAVIDLRGLDPSPTPPLGGEGLSPPFPSREGGPGGLGSEPAAFVADVADYPAVTRAAADIRSRFGRVDHVVFAAGVGSGKFGFPFWNREIPPDSLKYPVS